LSRHAGIARWRIERKTSLSLIPSGTLVLRIEGPAVLAKRTEEYHAMDVRGVLVRKTDSTRSAASRASLSSIAVTTLPCLGTVGVKRVLSVCPGCLVLVALLTTSSGECVGQGTTISQTKTQEKATSPQSGTKNKDAPRTQSKSRTDRSSKSAERRDLPGFYKGRRIADVMSWEGAEWLFRETRIEEEQPEAMLDALKIPRGATVADVGAGAGYHSIRLARRVGPRGVVLATDVQPEMLRMLKENAQTAGVTNVKLLRATQSDTKLPDAAVDLILMVDVYHECTNPERVLKGLFKALKASGRLVLVEFRGEDDWVPIKPEHKMTLEQVRLEVEPQGFVFKESLEFLPWQHVIIFEKPAQTGPSPGEKGTPSKTDAPIRKPS
jgi:ubiquinone/menaquinone biosynthesis C-methylase UbiE